LEPELDEDEYQQSKREKLMKSRRTVEEEVGPNGLPPSMYL
jgi:hypothetical protein